MNKLTFKNRLQIEKLYINWCETNHVKNEPNSLIAFLQAKNWLKTQTILKELPNENKSLNI